MRIAEVAEVWDPDHPVLRLLRDRRHTASKPLNRTDGARLGLAVEGGGMRGIVSASMLVALEDFGFADAFDVVLWLFFGRGQQRLLPGGSRWVVPGVHIPRRSHDS